MNDTVYIRQIPAIRVNSPTRSWTETWYCMDQGWYCVVREHADGTVRAEQLPVHNLPDNILEAFERAYDV